MNEDFRLPFFDPSFCLKAARWSLVCCVGWFLIELILLAIVNPESSSCANWTIHRGEPSEIKVWILMLLFTLAPTAWLCRIVVRWPDLARRMFQGILDSERIENSNQIFLLVSVLWALFCSLPLWVMLSDCTSLFQRLGFEALQGRL